MTQQNNNNSLQLVFSQENKIYTTSLIVSQVFEKEHKHILEAIRNLQCSNDFRQTNFRPSSYINSQNKETPMMIISKDGLSILVMGFTGEKAMKWKEKYIQAFNKMEEEIRELSKPKDLATMLIVTGEELRKKDIMIGMKNTKLIEHQPKLMLFNLFYLQKIRSLCQK